MGSVTIAAVATRDKLRQRGPPDTLMGVHDCPIPLVQKAAWSDPKYASNNVIPVRIQAHVIDLKEVDTVKQEFVAVIWVQMKWREKLPEGTNCSKQISTKDLTTLNMGKWKPALTFLGVSQNFSSNENLRPSHAAGDPYATLFYRYNIQGTFARRMELHFFPFDKQRLRVKAILWGCPEVHDGVMLSKDIEGETPGRTIKFEEGDNEIYPEGFIQTNAFTLYPNLVLKQGLTRPLYEDQIQYTTLSINCLLERKFQFFFFNFIIPIFLLGLLQMISFLLPAEDLGGRMNITILVILTTVAFRFSMAAYLPISAYLTMLDRYMLSSVFFQTLVALQNVIVYLLATTDPISDSDVVFKFNIWAGTACASCWVLMHISIPLIHRICYKQQDNVIMNDDTDFFEEKELEKSPI